jgi:GTP cyclohydrolase I
MSSEYIVMALLDHAFGGRGWVEDHHLADTPKRFLKAFEFWTSGYKVDPKSLLKTFEQDTKNYDTMVFQANIPVWSLCAHHLAPFWGLAHVAYIPNGKVVGLSKLARVVDAYARRLQTQENITCQVADCLDLNLNCEGVGVVLQCRHACYSDDTEVLTNSGFKRFSSLDQTELVAQYDRGAISFVKPTSYVAAKYDGPMHHWKSKAHDLLITPEHRCLVKSEWSMRVGHNYSVARAKDVSTLVYVPSAGLYSGTASVATSFDGVHLSSEQYCGLLGIYLADGSFTNDACNGYCITIRKTEANREDYTPVRKFLLSLPLNFKEERQVARGQVTGFYCRGRQLAAHFAQFGKSYDKFVPNEVLHAPASARREFLRMYMHGDGWNMPDSCQMGSSSRSRRLSEGIQALWLLAGSGCRVTEVDQQGSPTWIARPRQQRGKLKDYNRILPEQRSTGDYKGMVYCVNVPSGAIIVRRNGSAVVSGNCMESRGVQKAGTITFTSALRGAMKDEPECRAEFMQLVSVAGQGTKGV